MAGFGVYPAGLAPFGLNTPIPVNAPATGAAGSRFINPATKDYQQDPTTGQLAQMPAVRQRVLLALLTLVNSSSVNPAFGVRLPRKMGTFFESEMRLAIRAALKQLTDVEKIVRIDGISVERGTGGRSRTTVSYTDLTTGQPDQVEI